MASPNLSKYHLVLGDELMGQFSITSIKNLIKMWLEDSGALNVSSSVITANRNERDMCVEYDISFDSSCWTGIGFKGFNTKNRNFS